MMSSVSPGSFVLALQVDAPLGEVVGSYEKEMSAAGWTKHMSTTMDGGQMMVFGLGDRSANVTIFNEDGVTKISLSVGQ